MWRSHIKSKHYNGTPPRGNEDRKIYIDICVEWRVCIRRVNLHREMSECLIIDSIVLVRIVCEDIVQFDFVARSSLKISILSCDRTIIPRLRWSRSVAVPKKTAHNY